MASTSPWRFFGFTQKTFSWSLYFIRSPTLKRTTGSGEGTIPAIYFRPAWFTGWWQLVVPAQDASPGDFNVWNIKTVTGSEDRVNCCSEIHKYFGIQIIIKSHFEKESERISFFSLGTLQKHGTIYLFNLTEVGKCNGVKHSLCFIVKNCILAICNMSRKSGKHKAPVNTLFLGSTSRSECQMLTYGDRISTFFTSGDIQTSMFPPYLGPPSHHLFHPFEFTEKLYSSYC